MRTHLLIALISLFAASASCQAGLAMFALVRDGVVEDFWQFDADKPAKAPEGTSFYAIPRFEDTGWRWDNDEKQWETAVGKKVDLADVIWWVSAEGTTVIKEKYAAQLSGADPLGERRIDAAQSEFLGVLLHAYLQTTELLQLAVKAVAGTVATNNLTLAERARVVALRGQLMFPQQDDLSKSERDRAVELRDKLLIPHFRLYQEAAAAVESAKTNGVVSNLTNSIATK